MVVYAIFNNGVSSLVLDINSTLSDISSDVSVGAAPDINN